MWLHIHTCKGNCHTRSVRDSHEIPHVLHELFLFKNHELCYLDITFILSSKIRQHSSCKQRDYVCARANFFILKFELWYHKLSQWVITNSHLCTHAALMGTHTLSSKCTTSNFTNSIMKYHELASVQNRQPWWAHTLYHPNVRPLITRT